MLLELLCSVSPRQWGTNACWQRQASVGKRNRIWPAWMWRQQGLDTTRVFLSPVDKLLYLSWFVECVWKESPSGSTHLCAVCQGLSQSPCLPCYVLIPHGACQEMIHVVPLKWSLEKMTMVSTHVINVYMCWGSLGSKPTSNILKPRYFFWVLFLIGNSWKEANTYLSVSYVLELVGPMYFLRKSASVSAAAVCLSGPPSAVSCTTVYSGLRVTRGQHETMPHTSHSPYLCTYSINFFQRKVHCVM